MIFVALGANLPCVHGSPRQTLEAAYAVFSEYGLTVLLRSPWYETTPIPISDQPFYINGVTLVASRGDAHQTLAALHAIETRFGRVRSTPNAPRCIDLDLLDYDGAIVSNDLILPHPRMHHRAFVLYPLRDIAPMWRHPVLGTSVSELINQLPSDQEVRQVMD